MIAESQEVPPVLKFKRTLKMIDVNDISPNPGNPRDHIARKEVADIRDSIKAMGGVLVPIVVYPEDEKFILLDGERRWRACKELAKENPRKYRKIPANIIEKPLGKLENLRTMFNIHQKRKEWSTAAKAAAVDELLKLKGDMSVSDLMKITGLTRISINDALLFRRFPKEILNRCLNGELDEFHPILLGRNLQRCEKVFPDFMKNYNWKDLAEKFIMKVDKGFIRNSRNFMILSKIARICVQYNSEKLFESLFEKMVNEENFTPINAEKLMGKELGYKLEESFRSNCKDFLSMMVYYLRNKSKTRSTIPEETLEILRELYNTLREITKKQN